MILLTGATGFIGRALIPVLLDQGYRVVALVNKTPCQNEWGTGVQVIRADISDRAELCNIGNFPFTKVIHLAGYIPRTDEPQEFDKCLKVNVVGTHNLLEFAKSRGIRRFINSSTALVYGATERPSVFKENSRTQPATYYGMSKLLGEMLCERCREISTVKTISLRYAYVYGPGMPDHFVFGRFFHLARQGEDIAVYGQGKGLRDFIYVKDVISAIMLAIESEAIGPYNIGTGVSISLFNLAEKIILTLQSKSRVTLKADKKEDKSRLVLDIAKAGKRLGFHPVYSLDKGLRDYAGDQNS